MKSMTEQERFQAVMNFKPFDRLPMLEWASWWNKTIDRWHTEGLPPDVVDRYEICRHFGMAVYKQDWISVRSAPWKENPPPALPGGGVIASASDYDGIRKNLYPKIALDRKKWETRARERENGDVVLWFSLDGFFWFPRSLFGIERHLFAFYDQPELMHRINTDLSDWMLMVVEQLSAICPPDFMTFAEDLSYNHGPMLSKDLFDEFLKPYYLKVIPAVKKMGTIPIIDSDGDIAVPAYWFEEAGIEGILPLERQAGCDMAKLREEHPKMRFIGHFDKMTMSKGEAAMRAEFERLLPTAAKGGYLISCDHQTPPGVSYENYRIYVSLFKEYAMKAGKLSQE